MCKFTGLQAESVTSLGCGNLFGFYKLQFPSLKQVYYHILEMMGEKIRWDDEHK
jgi:hypothetical protein